MFENLELLTLIDPNWHLLVLTFKNILSEWLLHVLNHNLSPLFQLQELSFMHMASSMRFLSGFHVALWCFIYSLLPTWACKKIIIWQSNNVTSSPLYQ